MNIKFEKVSNKTKSVTLMASILILAIIMSGAFFTHRYVTEEYLHTGNLEVDIIQSGNEGSGGGGTSDSMLPPGSEHKYVYTIKNVDSTKNFDADVRMSILVESSMKGLDTSKLVVMVDGKRVTTMDELAVAYEGTVKKGTIKDIVNTISLSPEAGNAYANKEVTINVVIEVKQAGSGEWSTIATDVITIGGKDIPVVPKK